MKFGEDFELDLRAYELRRSGLALKLEPTPFGILALLIEQRGELVTRQQIVEAHRPGKGPKFTRVEMSDVKVVDHGTAAVVTCRGTYAGPHMSATIKFMRVWLKKDGRWQIIAGSVSNSE